MPPPLVPPRPGPAGACPRSPVVPAVPVGPAVPPPLVPRAVPVVRSAVPAAAARAGVAAGPWYRRAPLARRLGPRFPPGRSPSCPRPGSGARRVRLAGGARRARETSDAPVRTQTARKRGCLFIALYSRQPGFGSRFRHRREDAPRTQPLASAAPRRREYHHVPRDADVQGVLVLATSSRWACVLRLPTFSRPLLSDDEAIYATTADAMKRGDLLYRDVVDHKPPLIYHVYQAGFAAFGRYDTQRRARAGHPGGAADGGVSVRDQGARRPTRPRRRAGWRRPACS